MLGRKVRLCLLDEHHTADFPSISSDPGGELGTIHCRNTVYLLWGLRVCYTTWITFFLSLTSSWKDAAKPASKTTS